jgi:hypothetical protein
MTDLVRRNADDTDEIHARLKAAIEVPITRHLWTEADAITFAPALLDTVYGDGRALFTIGTINQRPAFWVIRGDSGWAYDLDHGDTPDDAPDFGDLVEDILRDMEEYFGRAECGYCGRSLSMYSADEWREADPPICTKVGCEAQDELDAGTGDWPSVDSNGGCHWGRMAWPEGFPVVKHPWAWRGNLLAERDD